MNKQEQVILEHGLDFPRPVCSGNQRRGINLPLTSDAYTGFSNAGFLVSALVLVLIFIPGLFLTHKKKSA